MAVRTAGKEKPVLNGKGERKMSDYLERFLEAHRAYYKTALEEISWGRKKSHWMWFIFPQIRGLGYSETAQYYAIHDIDEAQEYLMDPVLRKNTLEIAAALLRVQSNDAEKVMGWPDNLKLRSSMTLFSEAEPECGIFQRVLDKFFQGKKDPATLQILEAQKKLQEKFEFRSIRLEEAMQAAEMERICFPPNEACSEKMMLERVAKAPEYFLVAADRESGKLAGYINGLATEETSFRDEFFTDTDIHDPEGRTIMILGLEVLPEYRGQGLARELMRQYLADQREDGKKLVLLTCLQEKVEMYKKMGFHDDGMADSSWGGEEWHEMSVKL